MVSYMGDLHVWSLQNQCLIPDKDVGCFTYHEKNETASLTDQPYNEEKQQYTESRDGTWTPKNKRPERIRDSLKEVEDTLAVHKCITARWLNKRLLQIFLANGTFVTLMVSLHTADIDKIFIDKTLVSKLSTDLPSDVLIADQFLVVAYPDRAKLDYIYFTKKPSGGDTPKKLERVEKLSTLEPKISQCELPGPVGRRLDRHLSCSLHQDMVIVWWPTASEEAWPWSPMTGEKERANLCLLNINGAHLDLVTFIRTESNPINMTFSMLSAHQIMSVENSNGTAGEMMADICVYEANKNKIKRMRVTAVALQSSVVCMDHNASEDKVLLGCEDGTLILYDEIRKVTQMTKTHLKPRHIAWHPSGTIVIVASKKGEIQMFDMALAPLLFELAYEEPRPKKSLEIGIYFRSPPMLDQLQWCPQLDPHEVIADCSDALFIGCDRGPLCVLQLHLGVISQGHMNPLHLVNSYIKHRQIDEAVNLLSALSWDNDGQLCIATLSSIVNHLLREQLNPDREAQLEAALGTFYSPPKPLSESTVLEFRDPISCMARRFFHHLLRFTRFEKAFLLAVDIGAKDLFMDIHYLALDKGESALAEVARSKAQQIDSESLGTESVDEFDESQGSDSEEDSLDDSYEEEEEEEEEVEAVDAIQPTPPRPPRRLPSSLGKPLPPIPPEPPYAAPQLDPRFLPRRRNHRHHIPLHAWEQGYMYMPEAALQQLEEELSSEMYTEYTAALLDEIPPPQLPQELHDEGKGPNSEGDKSSKSVKVIHFGIV